MKKKNKNLGQYIFGAVVFVVLVAVVVGIILLTSKSGEFRESKEKDVAAVVNGEEITTAYLEEQYSRVPDMYRAFITKTMLLNQTINEVILLQEAEKQGITVSAEEVSEEINTAMEAAGVTEEELETRLEEQNITKEVLEDLYRKQLTINTLLEDVVFANIEVTDDDVEAQYNSMIRAMHILVETEEEADEIIEELKGFSKNRIEAGFSDIAKEKSIDPSAAMNGGDLGEFGKGQMVPEFEKAAFALDEYAFTAKPVQTQYGYHVILRLPKEQALEDQSESLKEMLLNQKKAEAVPLYLDKLRSEANVQVLFEEDPAEQAELNMDSIIIQPDSSAPAEEDEEPVLETE